MSVTQARRVVEFREQNGGYSSVDDLDRVVGFSREFLAQLKPRLTV
jgi:DNA uptake protein ComE-like DNA-binding protein